MDALSANELRVLGVLLEKAVTTPDQYPLTLNSIISGCNQKSSRDPVTSLEQGEVQRALRLLEDKLLVSNDPNLSGRVEKYLQRFCKPPFGMFEFDDAQYAVLTVLMLRGPATPGELRTRTDRMHKFASNEAVAETLAQLANWESNPLAAELPRAANRRDACWIQLFGEESSGADAKAATALEVVPAASTTGTTTAATTAATTDTKTDTKTGNGLERLTALEARVVALETALAELQKALGE